MNFKTNIRALCEDAFNQLSSVLNEENAQKAVRIVVEASLNSEKIAYETRIKNNEELRRHIQNQIGYSEAISVLNAIDSTLILRIKEVDDKLYDLQFLK